MIKGTKVNQTVTGERLRCFISGNSFHSTIMLVSEYTLNRASWVAQLVKNPPAIQETWVGKIPWRGALQSTPVFLPGESPWTEKLVTESQTVV